MTATTTPPPSDTDEFVWKKFACPRCKALVGQVCLNPNGTKYQYVHRARMNLINNPRVRAAESTTNKFHKLYELMKLAPGNWSESRKMYESCLILKPNLAVHMEQEHPELWQEDHLDERLAHLEAHWDDAS